MVKMPPWIDRNQAQSQVVSPLANGPLAAKTLEFAKLDHGQESLMQRDFLS